MSNSPNPLPPRRNLEDDEKIAIVVVLLFFGGIIWWALGSGGGVNFFSKERSLFSASSPQPKKPEPTITTSPKATQKPLSSQRRAEQLIGQDAAIPKTDTRQRIANQRETSAFPLVALPLPFLLQPSPQASPTPTTSPTTSPQATTSPTPKAETEKTIFADVPRDRWYYPFIEGLASQKLISGLSGNNFEPDSPVTRAQMANLINEAFDEPLQENKDEFKDVPQDTALTDDIEKTNQKGFMKGYPNDIFRPQQEIPRYQVLVALATGLNLQPTKDPQETLKAFDDASKIPAWAVKQVAAATEKGLVVNYPNVKSLNPDRPATRAEAATMIHQALLSEGKVKPVDSPYIVPE
jgi:hypothetical protein